MHRSFASVVRPLLEAVRPRVIVEVGARRGKLTRPLLAFCDEVGAVAHVIDPLPRFDVEAWQREHGERFRFHRALSHDVLGTIEAPDAVLIDGDHNWHTVLGELRLLDAPGRPYPLVVLHDVAWPYARRDLYYDPGTIPADRRRPFAQGGISPDRSGLVPWGMNARLHNAVEEGGPRNGVRTAVEDFVAESDRALEWRVVPGLHGIGVLWPGQLVERRPDFASALERLDSPAFLEGRVEEVERARLTTTIAAAGARRLEGDTTRTLPDRERELGAAENQLRRARVKLEGHERRLAERKDELRAIKRDLRTTRAALAKLDRVRRVAAGDLERTARSRSWRLARLPVRAVVSLRRRSRPRDPLLELAERLRRVGLPDAAASRRAEVGPRRRPLV